MYSQQPETNMRTMFSIGLVLAASCIAITAACAAESVPKTATCLWPATQDAVQAAPQNHRVIFENDKVRVLDVTVAPHTKEPVHAHCWASVLYVIEAGKYVDNGADGKVLFDSRSLATPPKLPMVIYKDPEAPHAVENLDDEPLHLIRVEMKPQAKDAA
jgi:mannose-6-phosphate isomerase-like protein (cupin superfamily)